jgi:hypothetical protein
LCSDTSFEDEVYDLPISIQLDTIEQIFCGREAADLWWLIHGIILSQEPAVSPFDSLSPKDNTGWENGYTWREELAKTWLRAHSLTK